MARKYFNSYIMRRAFISYICLLFIPVIIISILSFNIISTLINQQIEKRYDLLFEKVQVNVENVFDRAKKLSIDLGGQRWLNYMLLEYKLSTSTPYELLKFSEQVTSFRAMDVNVDDIMLYLPEEDMMIYSYTFIDYPFYFDSLFNIEGYTKESFRELICNASTNELVYGTFRYNNMINNGFLLINTLPLGIDNEINASLITYMNVESIENYIAETIYDEDIRLYIIDKENNLILKYKADPAEIEKITNSDFLSKLYTEEGWTQGLYNNTDGRLFSIKDSQEYEWTYLMSIPENDVLEHMYAIGRAYPFVLTIILILGIAYAYYFGTWNTKPVMKLISILDNFRGENTEKKIASNEYKIIENGINSLVSNEMRLRENIDRSRPILQSIYLGKLVNGEFKGENYLYKILDMMAIQFEKTIFSTIGLFVDDSIGCIHTDIYQIAGKNDVSIFRTDNEQRNGIEIYICNYDEESTFRAFIISLGNFLNQFQYKYAIGVGKGYKDIYGLSESCRESIKALEIRQFNKECSIIYYEDILNGQMPSNYYYPPEREKHIINLLRASDLDGMKTLFDELMEKNTGEFNISITSWRNLLVHIALSIHRAFENDFSYEDIGIDFNYLINSNVDEDVKIYMYDLFEKGCNYYSKKRYNDNNVLKLRIQEFIEEHYIDPNLTLAHLADEFNLNSSYFCTFFKEQFGCNFNKYLNDKRIKSAEELLKDKKLRVNDIVIMTGFNNDVTFRRLFYKQNGMTPLEYRKKLLM